MATATHKTVEYKQGVEDYNDGKDSSPFANGTLEFVDWFAGWLDARDQFLAHEVPA